MKYQWEKISVQENIPKGMEEVAKESVKASIIGLVIFGVFCIPFIVVMCLDFIPPKSNEFKDIFLTIVFAIIIPIIILYSLISSVIVKIVSYNQIKKKKYMKIDTEFMGFGGHGGNYSIHINYLVMEGESMCKKSEEIKGGMPQNLKEGDRIILYRTEICDDILWIKRYRHK